jgi:hypothetical protein
VLLPDGTNVPTRRVVLGLLTYFIDTTPLHVWAGARAVVDLTTFITENDTVAACSHGSEISSFPPSRRLVSVTLYCER